MTPHPERSAMEEWARHQLVKEDFEIKRRLRDWQHRMESEKRFRERHPWLARIFYGRDGSR